MTEAPQTALSHPLVVAYLADLDRALASADAQERLDTVTAVTEHLTDALGGDTLGIDAEPTAAQVQAVLDELGSVEKIADAATPASAPPASVAPAGEQQRGSWTAPALLATAIVSLVLPFLGAILAIGCIVAAAVLLRGENPRRSMLRATIAVSVVTLVVTAALVVGTLAWSTYTVTSVTETGGPAVSSQAAVVPTTGP
ncbi:MAG: hypothetical protein HGA51_02445 [Demequinaceae bacterium]|nr:hypothetical protein [Demequinaceae bacterium]